MSNHTIETEYSRLQPYYLLRCALDKYQLAFDKLTQQQQAEVLAYADKYYAIEAKVLATEEARANSITASDIEQALAKISVRYDSYQDYLMALNENQLNPAIMRAAIERELIYNAVMQRFVPNVNAISDIEVQLFYQAHGQRFITPETRKASHILITINSDYAENTREQAFRRIQTVAQLLGDNATNFAKLASKYSECATALAGGYLGVVAPGMLFPELDDALFNLKTVGLTQIVESQLGFHVIYCHEIHQAQLMPLAKVYSKIKTILQKKQAKARQKAWLAGLLKP